MQAYRNRTNWILTQLIIGLHYEKTPNFAKWPNIDLTN
jgi:hypothetical protein